MTQLKIKKFAQENFIRPSLINRLTRMFECTRAQKYKTEEMNKERNFVDLKSNSALLYNKGHNF